MKTAYTSSFWNFSKYALYTCVLAASIHGATLGKVVAIGGSASDLAMDEARGVLYIANFTANRVDVMSLADNSIQTSINVAPQPGSLALSPDGRYLVIAHFGNFTTPSTPNNALTILDLTTNGKQTFAMGTPPLGVAFGIDGLALVVTTTEFLLLDPFTGTTRVLDTIAGVTAKTLPFKNGNFPANIVASSMAASADGMHIYGITAAGSQDNLTMEFHYDVNLKRVLALQYTSTPPLGPRAVSVSKDGSFYLAGWTLNDSGGWLISQFPNPSGILNIGSHAIDSLRGLVYAQMNTAAAAATASTTPATTTATPAQQPVLQVLDASNLTVLERYQLAENLTGKSVMRSDYSTMYSISDSGVTVFSIGALPKQNRLAASVEDIVFRGSFCSRTISSQQMTVIDPGGNKTDFTVSSDTQGVTATASSTTTPATVKISVDPVVFQNQQGTVTATLTFKSSSAVNIPQPVRVLINNKEPDQRGSVINVPGKLVDILADPTKDRYFILRQDRNQVLVFDGANNNQVATLKTANTPTQMAISFDRRYLLIGNDNSWIVNVYDLETLQPTPYVKMPAGHYPRSIASSGKSTLVANRVAGPIHTIDRIDMATRTGTQLPTLGVYENNINASTILIGTPNGSSIMAAQADGGLMLYNANVDSFTISRKGADKLSGAYAASSFDQFVVGNNLLNASLVSTRQFSASSGATAGFAFIDQGGFRTTAPNASSPGVIERINLTGADTLSATRIVEAPVLGDASFPFTRTLAPLYSRNAIVVLTTSGFTVLPWNYDASVASPSIDRIVNAADLTKPVAPGGLISIFGNNLSPVNVASSQLPLPTALGESCLTVNGVAVPILFVSDKQINAQLPFQIDGNVTMILRTPGGIGNNYNLQVQPTAPSIFRTGQAGPDSSIPTVVRQTNGELVTLSNPIHPEDMIVIFLTGMGNTLPAIDAGVPAPADPLSAAIVPPVLDIAGVQLTVTYAGLSPGQVGVYQINATVPRSVKEGVSQSLRITQGGSTTTVQVRVVQ